MWDGFVPVDSAYAPPVYEGVPAALTLHNAGPGAIVAEIWDHAPDKDADSASAHSRAVQLRAGDTRTVTGGMVVLKFLAQSGQRNHAAAGWRLLRSYPWTP